MTGLRHSGDTVVNSFLSIFTLLHMMIGPTSRTLQSGPVFFVRLCVRSPKGRTFSFHIESYTFKQHHKNSWFNKILLTISASLVNVHQVQVVTVKWHTKKAQRQTCTSAPQTQWKRLLCLWFQSVITASQSVIVKFILGDILYNVSKSHLLRRLFNGANELSVVVEDWAWFWKTSKKTCEIHWKDLFCWQSFLSARQDFSSIVD